MGAEGSGRKFFRLILIKPTHYDSYVIQWLTNAREFVCLPLSTWTRR
jgi:hypothetical protein